jgi:hypothetical protein
LGRGVARGGDARWTGVLRSVLAWREEKQRQGMSGRQRSKRGRSSAGRSHYSQTTRWLRAAELVGSKAVGGQVNGCGPDTVGIGGAVVWTGRLMGGPSGFIFS